MSEENLLGVMGFMLVIGILEVPVLADEYVLSICRR